eukprot:CAMPEP_0184091496 /NCGR_PEP_ID=MMETSP0974-20121125/7767_1 /TAXON_ID=483370 /ORGANISM="non described non described, Strain CCMP2097" /LENGTH=75 /DNA_ID=CAMNT_0026394235 /DNA_START=3 /DNA_END=226 /DNA_ORIENTATION=+
MAHVPRQSGVLTFCALVLTTAVSTAGKRAATLEPSADKMSSAMAGSSLPVIFIFSGTSSSRRRVWNAAVICLHCA